MKRVMIIMVFIGLLLGCNGQASRPDAKLADKTLSITRWSDRTELFMEYPPLVAGEKARFAVHFTNLQNFKAVPAGQVTVELRQDDKVKASFVTPGPSRPGIFGVDVAPSAPGAYSMTVRLNSGELNDSHDVGTVIVYSDAQHAAGQLPEASQEEMISFLKEQQWTLDFATGLVAERPLRDSLRVPAEVEPRSGGEVEITAPVSGRLAASRPVPAIGTAVSKGETLARLMPRTSAPSDRASLEAAAAEAQAELDLARRDRDRVERLLAVRAIPQKRLVEARAAETMASARLKAAQARLAQHEATRSADGDLSGDATFLLRAPMSGVVARSGATLGASVEEGQSLFTIVATDSVYAVAHVPEADALRMKNVSAAELEVPGTDETLPLRRLVSIGQVVDSVSRTLSVVYEFDNQKVQLAVGQSIFLRLFTSKAHAALTIAESAVIDDAGRPVVFVQRQGESFVRRPVRLGNQESGFVQILDGVKPGERVVTRGGYLIRLSTMSSQIPAHGHVH